MLKLETRDGKAVAREFGLLPTGDGQIALWAAQGSDGGTYYAALPDGEGEPEYLPHPTPRAAWFAWAQSIPETGIRLWKARYSNLQPSGLDNAKPGWLGVHVLAQNRDQAFDLAVNYQKSFLHTNFSVYPLGGSLAVEITWDRSVNLRERDVCLHGRVVPAWQAYGVILRAGDKRTGLHWVD